MTKRLARRWSKRVAVAGGPRVQTGIVDVGDRASRDAEAKRFDRETFTTNASRGVAHIEERHAADGKSSGTRPKPLSQSRGPRALVVDDDPEIRRALARLLRPELEVYAVGSVAQAEAVLAHIDRVDVAFVDWELPDGTGEQILERLAHWPDAIRVLISARVVEMENPLENRALANLVLGKPLALAVVEALKRAALALPHG